MGRNVLASEVYAECQVYHSLHPQMRSFRCTFHVVLCFIQVIKEAIHSIRQTSLQINPLPPNNKFQVYLFCFLVFYTGDKRASGKPACIPLPPNFRCIFSVFLCFIQVIKERHAERQANQPATPYHQTISFKCIFSVFCVLYR